jgi:hypothetical protein
MSQPPIWVLLTTYHRTEIALKTIRGIKENFLWSNIGWVIADDATGGDHLKQLKDEIGGSYSVVTYDNEKHLGVGHNMNYGLRTIWEMGADLTLVLEDDWLLEKPFDPTPAVNLLMNDPNAGMVKWGYLSAGANADIISAENNLWLRFQRNDYTYIYTGHASLRHKRLHQHVGMFAEGLRAGENELDFCNKYNSAVYAPDIYWDLRYGHIGPFVHIGSESLADIPVG